MTKYKASFDKHGIKEIDKLVSTNKKNTYILSN